MYFSEKYIRMCGKAIEVQKQWKVHQGDYYADFEGPDGLSVNCFCCYLCKYAALSRYKPRPIKTAKDNLYNSLFVNEIIYRNGKELNPCSTQETNGKHHWWEIRCLKSSTTSPIWLPKQDQLQELAWDKECLESSIGHLLMRFNHRIHEASDEPVDAVYNYLYWANFNTFEQLWLAFVMYEKFKKVWDNTDWIQVN